MKTNQTRNSQFNVLFLLLLFLASAALAAVRYVDVNSTNATPPYTNWTTAAATIQQAVDAAAPGDEIVVTNGTYAAGGRAVYGSMSNRVAVDKPLTVRSVNGPQVTVIRGYQLPGTTNGDGAIRCVYLTNGASLSGFTLTNGATRVVDDYDTFRESSGGGLWCESEPAVVSNCVLVANSAYLLGGGAYQGALNNCTLAGNSAHAGGGAAGGTLNNCTLSANAAGGGGGAYGATLKNCTLTGNSAVEGGGAYESTLNNCTLTGNSAVEGGGAYESTLNNCIVYFNTAMVGANYAEFTTLNHCCSTPLPWGEGNISLDPQLASASRLSPGSPCRGAGSAAYATGLDIDGEAWATPPSIGCDEYHAGAVTGPLSVAIIPPFTKVAAAFPLPLKALIDGRATANLWEFGDGLVASNQPFATHVWTAPGDYVVILTAYNDAHPGGVSATGVVHVVAQPVFHVAVGSTNPVPPFASWGTAATKIQDAVDVADLPPDVAGTPLVLVSNGTYATGGRAVGTNLLVNRVAVDKPIALRSVNGPQFTVIRGYQVPGTTNGDGAIRCVYLTNGASLSGFTLTNGATRAFDGTYYNDLEQHGGGLWCESTSAVITNCVVTGGSASRAGGGAYSGTLNSCTLSANSACFGGGVAGSSLNNCTLSGNSAAYGGGAGSIGCGNPLESTAANFPSQTGNSTRRYGGGRTTKDANTLPDLTLNNCTLTGNLASDEGGGAYWAALNNCIVYFNTAVTNGANHAPTDERHPVLLRYCCTTPQPTNGFGNITNAPLFVDYASGNLHLQSNSPCINAGNNAMASGTTDLDGNPRIVSGTVDIGAYEFQGSGSVISYAWLQQYGLPTDGSTDYADTDHDGVNTWQEWRCGTDPSNALSALRLLSASPAGTNVTVTWQSVAGVNYFLERATALSATPAFTPLATNLPGQPGTTTYTDTNAASMAPLFYRVGVGN